MSDESIITLPSTASTKYYPGNKPNSYRVLLPTALELEGLWEVGITRIQYPFSAPNFEEAYVVIIVELEDGQRKSDAEFDTAADYFKAQCNLCRYNFSHDTKAQQLVEFTKNFIRDQGLQLPILS